VQVSWVTDGQRITVWVYAGADQSAIALIGERVNAHLATGAWASYFVPLGTW
jgi:hypothetical protein